MGYKLIGVDGKEVTQHDLQDKGVWCKMGASIEESFVELYGQELGLVINPEKESNPYAPDLLDVNTNNLADLKTQNTPFFKAQRLFNSNPQHTVVFNEKDRVRYSQKYPDIDIYFGVDWQVVEFIMGNSHIRINPMVGVWKISFEILNRILQDAPFHSYQQRKHDTKGNAKGSFILDLQNPAFEKVI